MPKFTNEQQFIAWNEDMAHKYDPEAYHLRSHFLIRWIERRRVKAILQFIQAQPTDRVLEVGCGAGNVLEQVTSHHLYGIDLSTFLLAKAQNRLKHYMASLVQSNGEQLPFISESFDKLICTEVLEHVTNPRQVISQMVNLAHQNSVIVISIPNEAWINRVKTAIQVMGLSRWLLKSNHNTQSDNSYKSPDRMTDEWHLHEFNLPLLLGFTQGIVEIQEVCPIPFAFLPLRYVVKCRPLK